MIPLKYIGKKPTHDDTEFRTGVWKKGEVKKVDPQIAPWMLFHDGVWEDARPKATREKDPIVPQKRPRSLRPDPDREHDVVHANIANMNKEGLQRLAKTTFNRDLPDMPLQQMRAEIRTMMRLRP